MRTPASRADRTDDTFQVLRAKHGARHSVPLYQFSQKPRVAGAGMIPILQTRELRQHRLSLLVNDKAGTQSQTIQHPGPYFILSCRCRREAEPFSKNSGVT